MKKLEEAGDFGDIVKKIGESEEIGNIVKKLKGLKKSKEDDEAKEDKDYEKINKSDCC